VAITAYSTVRIGNVVQVTAVSDLGGTIYYHWYEDGTWLASGRVPTRAFRLPSGEQARIEAIDTNDDDFDPIADAPDGWPARRTLFWLRDPARGDVDAYLVEQQKDGGDWETVAAVPHVAGQWSYTLLSDRLDDLAEYAWRVTPMDRAGNPGTPVELAAEKIVRTPDAPSFGIAFDPNTTKVTFSAD